MKNILFSGSIAALLLLTGCSSKEPAIDATQSQTQQTSEEMAPVATETVDTEIAAVDQENIAGTDTNEMMMSGVEQKFQTINFDFDKFNIRADMQGKVDSNAKIANGEASVYMIKLEGNCDEWGSDEYNYALGLRRTNSVKSALVDQGVAAERITMVSYGESNPVCSEKTQACWASNRRVDFKLLP